MSYTLSEALALIEKYESGGKNVPNYRYDEGHTAQGYYQITNSNWRSYARRAGIDLAQYPSAMSAPKEVQARVASLLFRENGFHPWSDFNAALNAAIGRDEKAFTGNASQLKKSPETVAPIDTPKTQAQAGKSPLLALFILGSGMILIVVALGALR